MFSRGWGTPSGVRVPGRKRVTDSFLCWHSGAGWKDPQLEVGPEDEKAPPRAAHDPARLLIPKHRLQVPQRDWQVRAILVLTGEERLTCY